MLKFLERKHRERSLADDVQCLLPETQQDFKKETKQDLAESFIRNNNFNGTSLPQYSLKCLSRIAKMKEICQGAFFIRDEKDGHSVIRFVSGFATPDPENIHNILEIGEGFPGQVAKDGKIMNLTDIPDGYFMIESGLGKAAPVSLLIFPVKKGNDVLAVIELSSFRKFTDEDELFFDMIAPSIAEQILKCKN